MRIHFIIHAPFETPGVIESWAMQHHYDISSTHTYRGEKLPDVSRVDFLVIMGGPQSPLEIDKYPYINDEIAFAKKAINQNIPVFGVCLGAQIIGASLGAATERSPHKEVGAFPIQLTEEGMQDPILKNLPEIFEVMHWHNDMPGVPNGAAILATSKGCPRQIVRFSDRVYGFQCHLEMTPECVKGMIENCSADLQPNRYVQDAKTMLSANLSAINEKLILFLNHLATYTKKHVSENVPLASMRP